MTAEPKKCTCDYGESARTVRVIDGKNFCPQCGREIQYGKKSHEEILIEAFNQFIKKWTGNSYPHLIDSDENDGERFREKIKQALDTAVSETEARYVDEIKKLKNRVSLLSVDADKIREAYDKGLNAELLDAKETLEAEVKSWKEIYLEDEAKIKALSDQVEKLKASQTIKLDGSAMDIIRLTEENETLSDQVEKLKEENSTKIEQTLMMINAGVAGSDGAILLSKQKKEIERLNILLMEDYQKQEELKSKIQTQKAEIERLTKLLSPKASFICQCEYCQKDDHINCNNPDLFCSCYCEELEKLDMRQKLSLLQTENEQLEKMISTISKLVIPGTTDSVDAFKDIMYKNKLLQTTIGKCRETLEAVNGAVFISCNCSGPIPICAQCEAVLQVREALTEIERISQ